MIRQRSTQQRPTAIPSPPASTTHPEIGPETPIDVRTLARRLGPLSPDSLRECHALLVMAVLELSEDAGKRWPWGIDDPTVALLRAVAKLSLVAPEATSATAAQLIALLDERDTARDRKEIIDELHRAEAPRNHGDRKTWWRAGTGAGGDVT